MNPYKVMCSYEKMEDVEKIVRHPKNPNTHSEKQIYLLMKILEFQGWRSPLIISKRSGFLISGHGRLDAAIKAEQKKVPINIQDFESEAQEHAHLISDNQISQYSMMPNEAINEILEEDFMADIARDFLGFDQKKLEQLAGEILDVDAVTSKEIDTDVKANQKCPSCGYEF